MCNSRSPYPIGFCSAAYHIVRRYLFCYVEFIIYFFLLNSSFIFFSLSIDKPKLDPNRPLTDEEKEKEKVQPVSFSFVFVNFADFTTAQICTDSVDLQKYRWNVIRHQ